MNEDLQKRIQAALANPQNMGEMTGADSIGTVGNADCGEMLRLWVKFKEKDGKRVIDRATFQSFGCETAIAVASLATELIRGKTAEEALALKTEELAGELGPLPPMKIHCAQLVEGALRSALEIVVGDYDLDLPLARADNLPGLPGARLKYQLSDHKGDPATARAPAVTLNTETKAAQPVITSSAVIAATRLPCPTRSA